jgi:hypothetical protein
MNTDYTKQVWALVALVAFFVLAKTYNDRAFVARGEQGVALQRRQLMQETRVAEALERMVFRTPPPVMTVDEDGRITTADKTANITATEVKP